MKNFIIIISILVLLFKTETVLSNNSIFIVNNIKIDSKIYKNEEDFLNTLFNKGFKKLIQRILLNKDLDRLGNIETLEIKNLISHYEILQKNDEDSSSNILVNLSFDREKINNFFYTKNITYADASNVELMILPIIVDNKNFYIFSENYFYKNWNIKANIEENDLIEYILPLENLENIQKIKANKDNLENLEISDLFSDYIGDNFIFLIINSNDKYTSIYLKGSLSEKKIIKNLKIENSNIVKEDFLNEIIKFSKNEILEIIKSQNIIDVRTPSFLNINLLIKDKKDLLNILKVIKKIDLIDQYYIQELSEKYVKLKIKYYGKINTISKKFITHGVKIKIIDNQWNLELI